MVILSVDYGDVRTGIAVCDKFEMLASPVCVITQYNSDKLIEEIAELAKQYKDVLAGHELYATGTTGTLIMGETGLSIHRMKSGPLGGDQQIGAMLANGDIDLIIFLRDPLTAQPHEPDVSALLRLCDVQSIPLATNGTSAVIMLEALKNKIYFS